MEGDLQPCNLSRDGGGYIYRNLTLENNLNQMERNSMGDSHHKFAQEIPQKFKAETTLTASAGTSKMEVESCRKQFGDHVYEFAA